MPVEPYEFTIAIQPEDIDELGHVNNIVYLRWVQEAATRHWRAAAPPDEQSRLLWIVLRHEIDYRKPALPSDSIIARTWVGAASRLKFTRHTEILRASDRALLASALTIWCPIDPVTLSPCPVSPEIRTLFST